MAPLFTYLNLLKMKAYKVWHDERYYIHKDTECEMTINWTKDIKEAKDVGGNSSKGYGFFSDLLGFNLNKRYDRLRTLT